jgi:phosphoserine phosphatase RsbU/P
MDELERLRRELAQLRTERAAYQAQSELLTNLVAMARVSDEEKDMLTATLKNTLDISTKLTSSEKGSLFLYDCNGAVSASLLTRANATVEESTQLIGTVLDKGLAGWVSRHRKVGLITDTESDDRWFTLPNQPYIVRSALAVPIMRSGALLGLLTLLHSEPGHFTAKHAHLMELTAAQIGLALEHVQLYTKLDKAKEVAETYSQALEHELEKGRQIQLDFLPDQLLQLPNWEIAACFYPARQVAGDFYDTFMFPNGSVGLVIADVCDKGVGAALFMALFRSLIRIFSGQISLEEGARLTQTPSDIPECSLEARKESNSLYIDPLKAVALTNNYIAHTHSQMSMFATMFFGVLDPETGWLSYVNGGHEPPIIISSSGVKGRLKPTGPAVGMMPDMKFKVQQIQLEPGDILMAYTDGVPEAHSPDGKFFSEQQLLSLVEKPTASASALLEGIDVSLRDHIGDRDQFDDITMLAVRRLELGA